LACLSIAGLIWAPLLVAVPLFLFALGTTGFLALRRARRSSFEIPKTPISRIRSHLVTAGLHILQPIARLTGRFSSGLTPCRIRASERFILPGRQTFTAWSEEWEALTDRLERLEAAIHEKRFAVYRGGEYDQWDLHAKCGVLGGSLMQMVIEEHGAGKQLVRCRTWPTYSKIALVATATFGLFGAWAFADQAWTVGAILASCSLMLLLRTQQEYSSATFAVQESLMATVEPHTLKQPVPVQEDSLLSQNAVSFE